MPPKEPLYRIGFLDISSSAYGTRYDVGHKDSWPERKLNLEPAELEFILSCDTFQTLEQHLNAYANQHTLDLNTISRLKKILEQCVLDGLFLTNHQISKDLIEIARHNVSKPEEDNREITLIGIPTRNRPAELAQCIESHLEHLIRYGRTPELIIADDSEGKFLEENRAIIAKCRKRYAGIITHFDFVKRNNFAHDLAIQRKVDEEIVRFIVCGDETDTNHVGALRNSILLYGQGQKILLTDDDTLCKIHSLPQHIATSSIETLTFTTSASKPLWFFDTYASATTYFPRVEIDYLGEYEKMVGRSVASLISKLSPDNLHFSRDISGTTNQLLHKSVCGSLPKQKIATVFPGIIGDSWMRVRPPTLITDSTQPHNLWGKSIVEYNQNKLTPYLARMNNGYSVYTGRDCLGFMSIDSKNIPLFPPRGVNENATFGYLLDTYFSHYVSGYIPYAIEHRRPISYNPDVKVVHMLCATWTLTLIAMEKIHRPDPQKTSEQNCIDLGNSLIRFSQYSEEIFKEVIIDGFRERVGAFIQHCLNMQKRYNDGPDYWHRDIDTLIKELELIATNDTSILTPFFKDTKGEIEGIFGWKEFQSWIKQWGITLTQWPLLLND